MTIVSSGAFIDALREHRLLSPERLAQLPHLAQGRCGEARAFARVLGQRGWLTIYQINQILAGNARDLVHGPYLVMDRLGQGGLSAVYKARHVEADWVVALKVIKPDAIAHDEGRQQFLHEMEAMARLDHPNIVQFIDVDQTGETFYFAMEFVDGTDLGKHVNLSGPLSVLDACDYIRQAALGLQHAHERNLVHRDIKPVNLFLTHQETPSQTLGRPRKGGVPKPLIKILDWGLAALRHPRGRSPAELVESVAQGIIGTADYLSPEQARNHHEVDIRGDIYSLGCTFYFLLTGRPPFPSGSLMQKIMQHQQAAFEPVEQFRGDVPAEVIAILKRMTAKTPEERFQTPAAVALALTPFARPDLAGITQLCRKVALAKPPTRRDQTPLPGALAAAGRHFRTGPHRPLECPADTSAP